MQKATQVTDLCNAGDLEGKEGFSYGAWVKPNIGVLILDFYGGASLSARGNGTMTETGGAVIVNSSADNAVFLPGNGTLRCYRQLVAHHDLCRGALRDFMDLFARIERERVK